MKKKWWGVLLALVVCVTGLCITASAQVSKTPEDWAVAKAEWSDPDTGYSDFGYFDTLEQAIRWTKSYTATVTLLDDVTLEKQIVLDADAILYYVEFQLDLNGHTLSGALDNEPLIYIGPATTAKISIRNGTIHNNGKGAAMRLNNGALTMEDVTFEGDVVLTNDYYNMSRQNRGYPFQDGCKFTMLYVEEGPTVHPDILLAAGCYLTGADGKWMDRNGYYKELVNVTVHACEHKDKDGNYYIFKREKGVSYCPECGNECPHDVRDENNYCLICKYAHIRAIVTYKSDKYKTRYFESFGAASGTPAQGAKVLKLLEDQENHSFLIQGMLYDIDLNGCTLTATPSGTEQPPELTLKGQMIGMINTSSKPAHYAGTILVGEPGSTATLDVYDHDNNLTIDKVIFRYGKSHLAGGTFGTIEVKNGITLQSLLEDGYYFQSVEPSMNIVLNDSKTSLSNVTVKKCDHDNYEPLTRSCYCGKMQYHFLRVKKFGDYNAYFETFEDAEQAADNYQDMITACRPISGTVAVTKNVAIDPLGRNDPLKENDHLAEAEFEVSGTLRFVHYLGERTIKSVHVLRGGKLELDPKYTTYDNAALYIKTLTVEDGGKAELTPNQRFDSIILKGDGITYDDFAAMLPEGMALQKTTDNSWAGSGDLKDVEGGKQLENVRVVPAPVTISRQPADEALITYGDGNMLPDVRFAAGDAFDADQNVYLSWHYQTEDNVPLSIPPEKLTFANGTAVAEAGFLTSLDAGTYTCYAELEYGPFRLCSEEFTVTIQPKTLRVAGLTVENKTYDGTTAAKVTDVAFDGVVNRDLIDYDVKNAAFAHANAGGNRAVSAMVSLTGMSAVNYRLENGEFTQDAAATILQAPAPATQPGALTVTNEQAASYTVELAELLPALDEDLEYGDVTYGTVQADLGAYYDAADGAIVDETGRLTLPIRSVASSTEGPIGQVSVTVHSTNFKDFTLTVEVSAKNPPKQTGGSVGKPPVKKPETDASGEHFSDVTERDYFYDAVRWAAENGITGGTGDGQFSPEAPCTRGQLVTLLWRAAGSPGVRHEHGFTDVREDAYYADAIRWAVREGIIAGYGGGRFGADDTITREQMALILYRWAKTQGLGFTGAWMFRLPFDDVGEAAYEAVAWCYMHGVTKGTGSTTFSPKSPCTRAQIVTFLYRLWQVLEQEK